MYGSGLVQRLLWILTRTVVLDLMVLQVVLLRAWHVQGNLVNAEVQRDCAVLILRKEHILGDYMHSESGITADIESEIRLFADDCVCYREIKDKEDTLKLQRDIDRLGNWARKWGMRFQPVKCNMMQLTNKHLNKIQVSYTLEGTVLENVDNIKYLGVTNTNDMKWNTHISNKGMVRPILDPHPDKLQKELEKVQNRAARFVTRNYVYETGSMTGILGQLKWESLKKRRKDNRLILL